MNKKEKIIIAYLKDFSAETIYKHHIQSFYTNKQRKPSKAILVNKYQYLLHIIITRSKANNEGKCNLNTEFYRDRIFHDHYCDMLQNLSNMGIIRIGGYQVGRHSKTITLMKWAIGYMTSHNAKFIKWSSIIEKRKEEYRQQFKITPFTKLYMDSLNYLRLTKKDEAIAHINEKIKDKQTHSYQYHISCINDFNEDDIRIYKIDEQKRIYHALTSLPRSLREFFNIKYEIDICNSHPLLLNYYLIKYYNIPIKLIKEANSLYHYDVECMCKLLKDNNIEVPNDIIEYIVNTQQGKFYEDFITEFSTMERSEVKKRVFAQIFYSHITNEYISKFCAAFIDRYPNVWKVIKETKIKTKDRLPHTMMRLESDLFRDILKECWDKGYKVVNLHDALVVFNVKQNKDVTIDELTTIIKQVYNRFGLFPTVKAEIT